MTFVELNISVSANQCSQIPYMQMAIKESSHKVRYFGSPWSSPAWMKTNNQINHGGFLKGHPGGKYYKLFAEYFVKYKLYCLQTEFVTPNNILLDF